MNAFPARVCDQSSRNKRQHEIGCRTAATLCGNSLIALVSSLIVAPGVATAQKPPSKTPASPRPAIHAKVPATSEPGDAFSKQIVNLYCVVLGSRGANFTYGILPLPGGEKAVVISGSVADAATETMIGNDIGSVLLPPKWRVSNQIVVVPTLPKPRSIAEQVQTVKDRILRQVNGTALPIATVDVFPLPGDRYEVHLYSTKALKASEIETAMKNASRIDPDHLVVIDHLETVKPPPPDPMIMRVHTLRFLRDSLPDLAGKNLNAADPDISGIGTDKAAKGMETYLNTLFPDTKVNAQENHITIKGPRANVEKIRQLLALYLDVPSPIVRADVLTIQVNSINGNRTRAEDKADEIRAGVQIVRDFIHGSQLGLAQYISKHDTNIQCNLSKAPDLLALMGKCGLDTSAQRPLGTNEMLMFLALLDRSKLREDMTLDRTKIKEAIASLDAAESSPIGDKVPPPTSAALSGGLVKSLRDVREVLKTGNEANSVLLSDKPWSLKDHPKAAKHREKLVRLIDRILQRIEAGGKPIEAGGKSPNRYVMDRVAKLYSDDSVGSDVAGITKFLEAYNNCSDVFLDQSNNLTPLQKEHLTAELSQRSASTDFLLKEAMYAVSADLSDLYTQPLMDWIRDEIQEGNAGRSGIDLVGTTSILVRDRTMAETSGSAEAWTKFTPIPKLSEALLTDAKTLSDGTGEKAGTRIARDKQGNVVTDHENDPSVLANGEEIDFDQDGKVIRDNKGDPVKITTAVATNPITALGALNPLQALAVKSIFAADSAQPFYRSIAPGTSLAIRPFVLSDGGSARVQMNLVTTINAQQPDAGKAAEQGRPVDHIKSHSVVTESVISAFDLVEVASFGAQTTAPGDYKWGIPILQDLPLIGSFFHGPQGKETHRQDSIAIVTLTILPRSLDLVPHSK